MANELYRTQVVSVYAFKRTTLSFFWLANNLIGESGYEVAKGINAQLFMGFGWLFTLTGLLADSVRFLELSTRRIDPDGAATFIDKLSPPYIPGRLPGDVQENFPTVWLKFHSDIDARGKSGVRIGPVPAGVLRGPDYPLGFRVNVALFITQHLQLWTTSSGVEFRAAIRREDGSAERITDAQLGLQRSRQLNRRWRA